jgi:hypothetical protein
MQMSTKDKQAFGNPTTLGNGVEANEVNTASGEYIPISLFHPTEPVPDELAPYLWSVKGGSTDDKNATLYIDSGDALVLSFPGPILWNDKIRAAVEAPKHLQEKYKDLEGSSSTLWAHDANTAELTIPGPDGILKLLSGAAVLEPLIAPQVSRIGLAEQSIDALDLSDLHDSPAINSWSAAYKAASQVRPMTALIEEVVEGRNYIYGIEQNKLQGFDFDESHNMVTLKKGGDLLILSLPEALGATMVCDEEGNTKSVKDLVVASKEELEYLRQNRTTVTPVIISMDEGVMIDFSLAPGKQVVVGTNGLHHTEGYSDVGPDI